jgi:hypothetical protein
MISDFLDLNNFKSGEFATRYPSSEFSNVFFRLINTVGPIGSILCKAQWSERLSGPSSMVGANKYMGGFFDFFFGWHSSYLVDSCLMLTIGLVAVICQFISAVGAGAGKMIAFIVKFNDRAFCLLRFEN